MSKELSRTPVIVKAIMFIIFLVGAILTYAIYSSPDLAMPHKLVGYIISLSLTLVPLYFLFANIIE